MDYRMFKAINGLASRSLILDMFMILISNKIRYLYAFVLIFMWFRDESYKKVTINTVISLLFTMMVNILIK
ncbi:hypothetical protein [Peribacillus alkalitolerans]|uniref:hypothetical protein n=1 Tax=Peribacillus alkalitolerans TaxID=1550385 RepID=UPI003083F796